MKLIFNDLTEIEIQGYALQETKLTIRSIIKPDELKSIFQDSNKTRKMTIKEGKEVLATYDGYTEWYSIEEYTGAIYGVNLYKKENDPEIQSEILQAAIELARYQAKTIEIENYEIAEKLKYLYLPWESGKQYSVGDRVRYEESLFKCLQAHTSQDDWAPMAAVSLWAPVLAGLPQGMILPWQQPESTNAYNKGDKVRFEGKTYESLIDNNVWSPSAYPAGWKEIDE